MKWGESLFLGLKIHSVGALTFSTKSYYNFFNNEMSMAHPFLLVTIFNIPPCSLLFVMILKIPFYLKKRCFKRINVSSCDLKIVVCFLK